MNALAESCLQTVIFPDLEQNCPGRERLHTELVVAHVRNIVAAETELELDGEVLEIAAYGYNWGHTNLSEWESRDMSVISVIDEGKEEHVREGARKMSRLLHSRREFSYLSDSQKYWVSQLIFTSDEIGLLRHPEELVLMEAGTLASFEGGGTESILTEAERASAQTCRVPCFIADYSRARYGELMGRDLEERTPSVSSRD